MVAQNAYSWLLERSSRALLGAILVAFAVAGCTTQDLQQPTPLAEVQKDAELFSAGDYRMQRGDQLEIHHISDSDYSALVVVRPDGKIAVPGIRSEVQAEGATVKELELHLTNLYTEEGNLKEPNFSVLIRNLGSQQVFVGGEVQRPGFLELQGTNRNVLQVLMAAGWLLPSARTEQVIIVRKAHNGKSMIFAINLDNLLSGADLGQNVDIRPMDAVFVPRSDIALADSWVDRYIRQLLPVSTNGTVGYIFTPTSPLLK